MIWRVFSNLDDAMILWLSLHFRFISPSSQATSFSSPPRWWWQWQGLLFPQSAAEMREKFSAPSPAYEPSQGSVCELCWLVERLQQTPRLPTLFCHSAITVKHCWMQWYMPEHLSTAQQWYLTQTTESTNAAAQMSLSHRPTGYELFTGNPEINSSQESCNYSQIICKL